MARGTIEKRGQRRRKIKPVILIVTEGSQTEPKYFEHYSNRQTNIDIRVVGSRTSGGETDYLSLIRKAVDVYKRQSQTTANIWKSWCRMLGGQIFLLVMNAWCLRLFTSMVGSFLANPLSL